MSRKSSLHPMLKVILLLSVCAVTPFANVGCQDAQDLLDDYRAEGVPFVTNVDPISGSPGILLTITGENFGDPQGSGRVTF